MVCAHDKGPSSSICSSDWMSQGQFCRAPLLHNHIIASVRAESPVITVYLPPLPWTRPSPSRPGALDAGLQRGGLRRSKYSMSICNDPRSSFCLRHYGLGAFNPRSAVPRGPRRCS